MELLTPKFDTCFFERYASVSLASLVGEPYARLVNRDRPDLQDEEQSIGIEVTRAIRENMSQFQTQFDCDLFTGQYRKIKVSREQRRSFYEEAITQI